MIELREMNLTEFTNFLERVIPAYANEKVLSGDWDLTDAMERARSEFQCLLPNGLMTEHHHLLSIVETNIGSVVGTMWIQERQRGAKRTAHLLDLFIVEPYRRRGFARQAMLLLEERARFLELNEVTLHVFGHNTAARALYENLGFKVIDLSMVKSIAPENRY